jgi:hypothetical protein
MSINKVFRPEIISKSEKMYPKEVLFKKYETVEISGFYDNVKNLFSILHVAPIGHRDRVVMEFDLNRMSYHTHLSPDYYDYPKGLEPEIPSANDLWLYFEHFSKMNKISWIISPDMLTSMSYNMKETDLEIIKIDPNLHFSIKTYLTCVVLLYMDREKTLFTKDYFLLFLKNFSSERLLTYLENFPNYKTYLSNRIKTTSGQTLDFFRRHPIPNETYGINISFYK